MGECPCRVGSTVERRVDDAVRPVRGRRRGGGHHYDRVADCCLSCMFSNAGVAGEHPLFGFELPATPLMRFTTLFSASPEALGTRRRIPRSRTGVTGEVTAATAEKGAVDRTSREARSTRAGVTS